MHALIGKDVIIRTVTYHYTGHVEAISSGFLTLSRAAWVADSGRWTDALATGVLDEVEVYPAYQLVHVALGAVVDVTTWAHELPTEQQ